MENEKEKAKETKTETPSSETEATAKEKAEKAEKKTEKPEEKQDKADETSDGKTEENVDNKNEAEGKPEKEAEKEADEEKPDETVKAMAALTSKYNALMIKDALTDAGEEYGLTRAQIPYIARMLDSAKLIEHGEVNTKALTDQLKGIVSAFPGLKAEKEEKTGIQLGAPINTEEGSETFADRIMAAAGLK